MILDFTYILAGAAVGFIVGLTGVGGGSLMTPLLVLGFNIQPAMSEITIYTDGSSLGNPGPGGYGVILKSGKHYKELSQGYRLTTNNRMELLAVIVALESLKKENSQVMLYTDSKYVVDAINKN